MMKPISDAWLIQIEITNKCIHSCANCTRGIRHFKKPVFMDLVQVEEALQSLQGWKKGVGCTGGEPTLHPEFLKICSLFKKYFPKEQCALFTCGGELYEEYKNTIMDTFGIISYNDHSEHKSYHRPLFLAIADVVKDPPLQNKLIHDCWVQRLWSPLISIKGAFFCEVAATFDLLFNGPGGYQIIKDWWKRKPTQYKDQVNKYCKICGMSIPFESPSDKDYYELVSINNFEKLKKIRTPVLKQLKIKRVSLDEKKIIDMQNSLRIPYGCFAKRYEKCFLKIPSKALNWYKRWDI